MMKTTNFDTTTILYVDDEEMARKYFSLSFGADYEVLTAADADAAVAILQKKENRVGIVVTDYRMPGRNGGDLLRQIARDYPHTIRILLTAFADREVLLDTVNSSEIFRILEKPINVDEGKTALRLAANQLRERSARQQRIMAIDETLVFLAHELNTPLAAILNYSRGVQRRVAEGNLPPPLKTELGKAAMGMDDNARYCLALLASFALSVRDTVASPSTQEDNTAHQMILSLLDSFPLTPVQRAAIRIEVQEDFMISALPNCVTLVLSSLLGNALRALHDWPAPMISFTVSAGDNPQIRITDNGPGIPPVIQNRLMVDPVTTHSGSGGHGWGLIFCKRIMQSFGGGIMIRSIPGAYTTVTLNFPAAKALRTAQ